MSEQCPNCNQDVGNYRFCRNCGIPVIGNEMKDPLWLKAYVVIFGKPKRRTLLLRMLEVIWGNAGKTTLRLRYDELVWENAAFWRGIVLYVLGCLVFFPLSFLVYNRWVLPALTPPGIREAAKDAEEAAAKQIERRRLMPAASSEYWKLAVHRLDLVDSILRKSEPEESLKDYCERGISSINGLLSADHLVPLNADFEIFSLVSREKLDLGELRSRLHATLEAEPESVLTLREPSRKAKLYEPIKDHTSERSWLQGVLMERYPGQDFELPSFKRPRLLERKNERDFPKTGKQSLLKY